MKERKMVTLPATEKLHRLIEKILVNHEKRIINLEKEVGGKNNERNTSS